MESPRILRDPRTFTRVLSSLWAILAVGSGISVITAIFLYSTGLLSGGMSYVPAITAGVVVLLSSRFITKQRYSTVSMGLILSILPVLLGISISFSAARIRDIAVPALIIMSIGWSLSSAVTILWLKHYQEIRAKKLLAVAGIMYTSDQALLQIIPNDVLGTNGPHVLRDLITYLLERMCDVLAYRLPPLAKGASFLVITGEAGDARFSLYAQVHHDEPMAAQGIEAHLRRDRGLAGHALASADGYAAVQDIRDKTTADHWVPTSPEPKFRSHAVVRVRAIEGSQIKDIGVLCFDTQTPWTLSAEDRQLMMAFADKIASLWMLFLPSSVRPNPSSSAAQED